MISTIALKFLYIGIGETRCLLLCARSCCAHTAYAGNSCAVACHQHRAAFDHVARGLCAIALQPMSGTLFSQRCACIVTFCACTLAFYCRCVCRWRPAAGVLDVHQCAPDQQAEAAVPQGHHETGQLQDGVAGAGQHCS